MRCSTFCLALFLLGLASFGASSTAQAGGGRLLSRKCAPQPTCYPLLPTYETWPVADRTVTYKLWFYNPGKKCWEEKETNSNHRHLHDKGKGKGRTHVHPTRWSESHLRSGLMFTITKIGAGIDPAPNPTPAPEKYCLYHCISGAWIQVGEAPTYDELYEDLQNNGKEMRHCTEPCGALRRRSEVIYFTICAAGETMHNNQICCAPSSGGDDTVYRFISPPICPPPAKKRCCLFGGGLLRSRRSGGGCCGW